MLDYEFPDGLAPAHKHPNGGGWVADTAYVAATAYIGPLGFVVTFSSGDMICISYSSEILPDYGMCRRWFDAGEFDCVLTLVDYARDFGRNVQVLPNFAETPKYILYFDFLHGELR